MPPVSFDDHSLGQLATESGLLSPEQLRKSLEIQKKSPRKQLGAILIENGFLSSSQLLKLLIEQADRVAEEETQVDPVIGLFGQLLVEEEFATEEQVDLCLWEQAQLERIQIRVRLGEVLISNGYMTADQVQQALGLQDKVILACPQCDVRYNIARLEEGMRLRCFDCEQELVRSDGSVMVQRTINVRRMRKILLQDPLD